MARREEIDISQVVVKTKPIKLNKKQAAQDHTDDSLSEHSFQSHLNFLNPLIDKDRNKHKTRHNILPEELAILRAEYAKSVNWNTE